MATCRKWPRSHEDILTSIGYTNLERNVFVIISYKIKKLFCTVWLVICWHYIRYVKIGFSLDLKLRNVISFNAKYGGSGQFSRNTILLKVHEFITTIVNSEDYMYGSENFDKFNEKRLLDFQINGEIFNINRKKISKINNKYLWRGASLCRNVVSQGGVYKVKYETCRRWVSSSNDSLWYDIDVVKSRMILHKSEILNSLDEDLWPESKSRYFETLALLQKVICSLSIANKDKEAMVLISKYFGHIVIRFLAINRVSTISGNISGIDGKKLKSKSDKYLTLNETNLSKFKKLSNMEIKRVETEKKYNKIKFLSISCINDRVLQMCAFFY